MHTVYAQYTQQALDGNDRPTSGCFEQRACSPALKWLSNMQGGPWMSRAAHQRDASRVRWVAIAMHEPRLQAGPR